MLIKKVHEEENVNVSLTVILEKRPSLQAFCLLLQTSKFHQVCLKSCLLKQGDNLHVQDIIDAECISLKDTNVSISLVK